MGETSKIEWCDATFNPWTGCTKVSPGCANCYAEGWSKRTGIVEWGPGKPRRRTSEANWRQPLKWNRVADPKLQTVFGDPPHRPRVFCASLADWLDPEVPIEWLADLLDLIRRTPNLDWLLLTKRPENWRSRIQSVLDYYPTKQPPTPSPQSVTDDAADAMNWVDAWLRNDGIDRIPENVWIGTTVEDGPRKERLDHLRAIPAVVRFLSCEPLLADLGYIDLSNGIDWVIAGGESGPKCRPFDPEWARELRDQCRITGTAFFMKQMGGVRKPFPEIPEDLMIREFPTPVLP